jgi:UDP:flavonoid glycosyltransferase YjiC (YdhE family)
VKKLSHTAPKATTMSGEDQEKQAQVPAPPQIVLDQAFAAAESQDGEQSQHRPSTANRHDQHHGGHSPHLEHVPPPAYNGKDYGQLDISQNGLDTGAKISKDGRVNIKINARSHKVSDLLVPALRKQLDLQKHEEAPIPEDLAGKQGVPPPPMNIVIQIVGSRGDVQPFIALGKVLKQKYNHRVRIATHPTFRDFVTSNGLEFFSIGGDPAELMAFMVKNPGLMPGMDSLKSGDVGKRRKGIYEIVTGCWRSCIEAGDGTGVQISDDSMDTRSYDSRISNFDPTQKPFVADCIIANPPSFAHVHLAEKLGIPLHLMFTMPWSPTQQFPHPLANIVSSNADPNMANFVTYALVDMLTWQGLGDVINRFRERSLRLEPISIMWAPGMASRLRIPYTYCWSPALIPKPHDWGNYIDISGFYFLDQATNYCPDPELAAFLDAGPPPVYIGFGSIVVDDPNAMTKMIFEAVKMVGTRALISKGWGGLGADELGIPEGCYMLGNCPHDWLFKKVSCVVHHGGAGTTAAGIAAGRPTVVVPFFGDQPFWGAMCAKAGAGPMPIPYKNLTAEKLANQIKEALKPESLAKAKELSQQIATEKGTEAGAESFHNQLRIGELRCSLAPERVAVWRVRRTDIRLSALAATVLANEGLLGFQDLKLYRAREYETEDGPWEPISGGAAALIGTLGNLSMGVADFPVEILKALKIASNDVHEAHEKHRRTPSASGAATPIKSPSPDNQSTNDLTKKVSPSTPPRSDSIAESQNGPDASVRSDESTAANSAVDPDHRPNHRQSSLSKVLSPDGSTRSRSNSRRRWSMSPGGSPRRPYGEEPPKVCDDVGHITVESAVSGAKAAGRIVSAGMKSPMDFTLSLAQGFHNAPKLYGDTTVRKPEKITDFQSGLKAAGKEFGYGFYDGITGLLTQPIAGARKEGAAGFIKGAAKGIGGIVLKPGAAVWGIPGYTSKGIYAEISKRFGASVQNYIISARTAQGYEDWNNSSPEERLSIVAAWNSAPIQARKNGRKYGDEHKKEIDDHILTKTKSNNDALISGFKNTRHLTWEERKELSERKQRLKKEEKEMKKAERTRSRESTFKKNDSDHHLKHTTTFPSIANPPSYGRSKSRDQIHDEFEIAIKRSVTETSRGDPQEDAMIERALRASVKELQDHADANGGYNEATVHDDDAYKRAIHASVAEAKRARGEQESGVATRDDAEDDAHDLELARALTQSLEDYKAKQGSSMHDGNDDEALSRAITASEEADKKQREELDRQKTEEEIVMEYVKKQSLLEEEHRRKKEEGAGNA